MTRWRDRLVFWWHSAVAVVAACAIAATAWTETHTDSARSHWWLQPKWQYVGLVTIAAATLVDQVVAAWRRYRRPAAESARADVQQAVFVALVELEKVTEVPILQMGISVFRVRRYGPPSWPLSWPPLPSVLHRDERSRYRVAAHPQASKVRFTKGKGVIGECWRTERPEYVNWMPIAKKYADSTFSEDEWRRMSQKTTWGFSRQDFLTIVRKYAEVKAVPLKKGDGQVVGVLALDRQWRPEDRDDFKRLDGRRVEELLTDLAEVVRVVTG